MLYTRCDVQYFPAVLLDSFQEKQILQKAHGQREVAFNSANGVNLEAKRCVDMWLKMPGKFRIKIQNILPHTIRLSFYCVFFFQGFARI